MSSAINHDIINLPITFPLLLALLPQLLRADFLIPSTNAPSISHTFFLYVSRHIAQLKDYIQLCRE